MKDRLGLPERLKRVEWVLLPAVWVITKRYNFGHIMRRAKALPPFLLALVLLVSVSLVADDRASFEELASAANSASDLSKTSPHQLDGIVTVYSSGKPVATGYFRFARDSDNSGEYLEFKDYREIAIANGNTLYVQRTPEVDVPASRFLRYLEGSWQALLNQPAQATTRQPSHSSPPQCFLRTFAKDANEVYCFDTGKKLLVTREIKEQSVREKIVFSDYQPFEGQQIPRVVQDFENGELRFQAQIKKIMKASFAAGYFVSPPSAKGMKVCRNTQPAILVKRTYPDFPVIARAAHLQGEIRIGGTIDTEGKLINMRVLSGHPTLAQGAMEALKNWRYIPAYCPSGPVESQTEITITFHM